MIKWLTVVSVKHLKVFPALAKPCGTRVKYQVKEKDPYIYVLDVIMPALLYACETRVRVPTASHLGDYKVL